MKHTKPINAFVYLWKQKSTGMWYLGSKSSKGCHPGGRYICSSKTVKPLIKANPEDWTREIVQEFGEDALAADNAESEMLEALNAKYDPMSYNMHNGDGICNDAKTRAAVSAKHQDPIWKAENSAAVSAAVSAANKDPMKSAKRRASVSAMHQDPIWKAENRAASSAKHQDPIWKAENSAAVSAKHQDPIWKAENSAASKKRWDVTCSIAGAHLGNFSKHAGALNRFLATLTPGTYTVTLAA